MTNINLNEMTIEALRNLRAEINANIKARKTEVKETKKIANEKAREELNAKGKAFLANFKLGDTVRIHLKDEIVEAELVKISEKTFTVKVNEKNIWRYFYQLDLGDEKIEENAEDIAA